MTLIGLKALSMVTPLIWQRMRNAPVQNRQARQDLLRSRDTYEEDRGDIKSERLNQVKAALEEAGFKGLTVGEVRNRGEQRGLEFINRAGKYFVDLLPRAKMECVVNDKEVNATIDAIVTAARTGEMRNGKIFVSNVEKAVRIRIGESDNDAM